MSNTDHKISFSLGPDASQVSMCNNCENQFPDVSNPTGLGRQRMTSHSICESLIGTPYQDFNKQYSEIVLSYHKLKISFSVMLILNMILLVAVIICLVFIIPHLTANTDTKSNQAENNVPTPQTGELVGRQTPLLKPSSPSSRPRSDATMVKCQTISDKLGAVYKNGQKVDEIGEKMCSMGDMIESVMQNMKIQTHKKVTKAAFHITSPTAPLVECQSSRTLKCLNQWKLKMKTTRIQINGEKIIVPRSGIYFIYNRVTINMNVDNATSLGDIQHSVMYSNSGNSFKDVESSKITCVVKNNQFSHVSYIEKMHFLERGDELQIALKTPINNKGIIQSSSAFGMFEL